MSTIRVFLIQVSCKDQGTLTLSRSQLVKQLQRDVNNNNVINYLSDLSQIQRWALLDLPYYRRIKIRLVLLSALSFYLKARHTSQYIPRLNCNSHSSDHETFLHGSLWCFLYQISRKNISKSYMIIKRLSLESGYQTSSKTPESGLSYSHQNEEANIEHILCPTT